MIPVKQYVKKINFKKIILFGIVALICSSAFYWLQYESPAFIEALYIKEDFSTLNKLTNGVDKERLEFYLGRANEIIFGPLSQLVSGLLFTGFALLFLQNVSLLTFGFFVLVYLIVTKLEVLFFPPYGDAIGGPFAEALWLFRHSFDYQGLLNAPGYANGGPRVYLFSVFPTYLAFLMKLIPDTKMFLVVNHLITFAFSATIVAVLRNIFRKMFPKDLSILAALVLLFLPLFQSQTEAINMEIPCTLFIMLAAYALINKRIHLAGILTIAAVLVKGTAVFACGGFFLVGLFLFFGKTELRFKKRIVFWSLVLVFVSLGKVYLKFLTNDQHVSVGMIEFAKGWPSFVRLYIFYFYVAILALLLVHFVLNKWRAGQGRTGVLPTLSMQNPAWMMLIFAGMWFLLFLNFYTVSPRYRVAVYPFMVFGMFYVFSLFVRSHVLRKRALILTLSVALFSSYGFFYPPMLENDHVQLERSLEYRNDFEVNRRVAKTLEDRYNGFRIGAPFILAQLLGLPELGYVSKSLDIMIYGFQYRYGYGGIKEFPGIDALNIGRTIYVGVKSIQQNKNFPYPVNPGDRVIEEIHYGNKAVKLFMGGISIEMVLKASRMLQLQKAYEQTRQ